MADSYIPDSITALGKALEPHRRMQQQIAKMLEPQRRMQEQIAKMLEPQRRMQEQIAKMLEPQRRMQEQLAKALEPQRRIQEQLAKTLQPQRQIQEQLAKALEPQRQMQEQLARLLEPQWRIGNALSSALSSHSTAIQQLSRLNREVAKARLSEIQVVSENQVEVGASVVSVREISEEIESIPAVRAAENGIEFVAALLDWLSGQTEAVKNVVLFLVLPYVIAIFANLTTSIYEEWWLELRELPAREVHKSIVREANRAYEPEELLDYRFVTASVLHVREQGGMKHPILGELHQGKIVRLLIKNRRWSLVEYVDIDTGEISQGWVFSRYLGRFSK